MLVNIEDIKVNDRIRKDFGNIQELADDIKENGLINPLVVTDSLELIAGERRLRALRLLEYSEIEVRSMTVKDAEHQLNLEISENETRKDFSKAERIEYARRLERIEKIKAEQRKISTLKQNIDVEKFPERSSEGQVRDIVAEKLNIGSGKQYEREKMIVDNKSSLTPEDFANWDEGKLSTNKAYLKIKAKNQSLLHQISQLKCKTENINILQEEIDRNKEQLKQSQQHLLCTQRALESYKRDSEEYKKLKADMGFLTLQKNDLSRQINSATELSGLTVKLQTTLEKDLAPIKFKRCMEVLNSSDVAIDNLCDILRNLKKWINEIEVYLPNNIIKGMDENIIDIVEEKG